VVEDGGIVKYSRGDGSTWSFQSLANNGVYHLMAPASQSLSVINDGTQFTVTYQNGEKRLFDLNTGSLTAIQDRNGNTTSIAYDNLNRPVTITDAAGRHMFLGYNDQNFPFQVTNLSTSVSLLLSYAYDAQGNLATVIKPDLTHINFQYDSNSLITAVTDNQGKILESHTYDSSGRGLTSARANGVESLTLAYDNPPGTIQLTDSLGHHTSYASGSFGGKRYVTDGTGPGCSSCGMRGDTANAYDSQGRVTSSTAAAGHTA